MEFLMGRSLLNALNNLGVVDQYTEALREMGYKLEDLIEKARPAELEQPPCSCTDHEYLHSSSHVQPSALCCCLITQSSLLIELRWACNGSAAASAVSSYYSFMLSHCMLSHYVQISGCLKRQSDSKGWCAGAGCCAGQWGVGPPGSLLPGLYGRPQPARLGLWDPLPVRHVQTGGLRCTTAHSAPHARA